MESSQVKYFELYADHFDLRTFIHFKHRVLQVRKAPTHSEDGRWIVKIEDLEVKNVFEKVFDGVMVCVGHRSKIRIPEIEGQDIFKGTIIDFRSYFFQSEDISNDHNFFLWKLFIF